MKFNVIAITILLSFVSTNFAVLLRMPGAEELENRLRDFTEIVKETDIIEKLAGQVKETFNVFFILEVGLLSSNTYMNTSPAIRIQQKHLLFKALFCDYPQAFEELNQLGIYVHN